MTSSLRTGPEKVRGTFGKGMEYLFRMPLKDRSLKPGIAPRGPPSGILRGLEWEIQTAQSAIIGLPVSYRTYHRDTCITILALAPSLHKDAFGGREKKMMGANRVVPLNILPLSSRDLYQEVFITSLVWYLLATLLSTEIDEYALFLGQSKICIQIK